MMKIGGVGVVSTEMFKQLANMYKSLDDRSLNSFTNNVFIIPQETKLKQTKESSQLKDKRKSLRDCSDNEKSKNGKRVYNIEIVDE